MKPRIQIDLKEQKALLMWLATKLRACTFDNKLLLNAERRQGPDGEVHVYTPPRHLQYPEVLRIETIFGLIRYEVCRNGTKLAPTSNVANFVLELFTQYDIQTISTIDISLAATNVMAYAEERASSGTNVVQYNGKLVVYRARRGIVLVVKSDYPQSTAYYHFTRKEAAPQDYDFSDFNPDF